MKIVRGKCSDGTPLRILVVSDAHTRANEGEKAKARWRALARFALKHRPDVILFLGDHWCMPSLSIYDGARSVGGAGSNKKHQGLTIEQDILAGKEAIVAFEEVIATYNRRASRSSRKWAVYNPRKVFCMGNHEARLDKVPEHQSEMAGKVGTFELIQFLNRRFWEVVPFLTVIEIAGVHFCHYFPSGPMRRPTPISRAIANIGRSAVWGNGHVMAYLAHQTPLGGWDKYLAMPSFKPEYALAPQESSGVVLLDNVLDGDFEFAVVSTKSLLAAYDIPLVQEPQY